MMHCLLAVASVTLATAVTSKYATFGSSSALPRIDSYEDFRTQHGHRRGTDTVSYEARRQLYHNSLAKIAAHNNQGRSWHVGVNRFADYTDQELQAMLGYKRWARSSRGPSASSFLQLKAGGQMVGQPKHKKIKSEVDWRSRLASSKFFRDQGSCGSCWAVATVGALEMQSELMSGNTTQLSFQQLVDCVPNPRHCGGTGGCNGATAELAFEYVHLSGLGAVDAYSDCQSAPHHASIASWHRLPTNEAQPVMMAIAEHGPVVLSVDGSAWFNYDGGVFAGCQKDAVVNHAVLALGYGKDESMEAGNQLYWLIRNSWGETWGEGGHIRLLRHSADDAFCGVDNDPKQGVGCDGGPKEIPVCGMCGILSDSSHPMGALIRV